MGNCQKITSKENPILTSSIKSPMANYLILIGKTFTWNRDSHGLFDYENKNIYRNVFKITQSGHFFPENSFKSKTGLLLRENNEVKMIKTNIEEESFNEKKNDTNTLAYVIVKDNSYYLTSSLIERHRQNHKTAEFDGLNVNNLWIVVRSLKVNAENRVFKLSSGDFIKLGRIRFRIKELSNKHDPNLPNEALPQKNNTLTKINNNKPVLDIKTRVSQLLCRICLSDLDEDDNPFITPCKCAGSMQFIHIRCLQQWLKSKLQVKQTFCSLSFVWKNFECELCKTTYPDWIEANGVRYDIVEIPKPESPYLVLEILSRDKNQCRGVHVLNMGLKSLIKLGRGHDSELRITDISVSRCHALLKYEKGSFYIEDNNSKFGTLVLVKEPIPLSLGNNHVALQVGRTVLYFSLKKTKKVLNAFIKTDSSYYEKKEENLNASLSPIHNLGTSIYDHGDHNNGVAEEIMYDQNEAAPEEEIEREIVRFGQNPHLP